MLLLGSSTIFQQGHAGWFVGWLVGFSTPPPPPFSLFPSSFHSFFLVFVWYLLYVHLIVHLHFSHLDHVAEYLGERTIKILGLSQFDQLWFF